ncbi:MAG: amidohydrolase family protein [Bdellovibrionota bacterium]
MPCDKRIPGNHVPCSLLAIITIFLSTIVHAQTGVSQTPADLILKNGKIYTDRLEGRTWSQALSVRGSNIQTIGSNQAIETEKGPLTKVIDLKGRVVLPGFNDAHLHFFSGGLGFSRVDLVGITNIPQLQDRLKIYAAANPSKPWVFGQGWDHTALKEKRHPNKIDLDAILTDRPVMLNHLDGHLVVVNSKALELLGIEKETPDPEGGRIEKNELGEPTGILIEAAAWNAMAKVDKPSVDELRTAFKMAQEEAHKFGLTSIQGGPWLGEHELKVLEEMHKADQLRIRYSIWGELERPNEYLELRKKYRQLPEEWVRLDTLKGFVDGVLSMRTAALTEPYADDKKTKGEPLYPQDKLNELVLTANRLGLTVALHAVGDRAVSMSFAALAKAKRQLFNSRVRNRIEHMEVIPKYLFPKFTEFNIIASVQPSHLIYENESKNYNDARLGPKRVKDAFAWKSLIREKAHLAFGTDWPVMPLNPFLGIYGAVHRQHYNGKPRGGWQPAQRIILEQAIEAYTLGPAYATREEHVKGSIREGKYADLVILEKDPFQAKGKDLLKVSVSTTIVAGKIVYDTSVPMIGPAPSASPKP